jgi:hypothetical protein
VSTPAAKEFLTPSALWARFVRFLDACTHFTNAQLGSARVRVREDAAGSHELDEVRSGLHLLSDCFAHFIGTVNLVADLPPVSTGHTYPAAGGKDPWSFYESLFHYLRQEDIHIVRSAQITDRRGSGSQSGTKVVGRYESGEDSAAVVGEAAAGIG